MTGSIGAGVNRLVHSTVTSLGIFSNTDSFSSSRREQVEYTSVPPGLRAAIPECSSIRCNLANLVTARVLHSLQVRGSPCQTRPLPEHGTSTRTRSKVGPKRFPKDAQFAKAEDGKDCDAMWQLISGAAEKAFIKYLELDGKNAY